MRSLRTALQPAALAVLLACLLLPTASAAPATVQPLQSGDAALNQPIIRLNGGIAFLDANADGQPNAAAPAEPVYLDADGSLTVSYGDMRLSGYVDYPAGTLVDATNSDLGRPLTGTPGWFATSGSGAWYVDTDASRTLSASDIDLAAGFSRVEGGASGQALTPTQQQVSKSARFGYLEADNDGHRSLSDPFILDLDADNAATAGRTTLGDVRITGSGPGVEKDTVGRAEFEQALDQLGVEQQQDGSYEPAPGGDEGTGSSWGTPETFLLILGLANLVGLGVVYARLRDGGAPRNPFK